jgi:hypothetical protein
MTDLPSNYLKDLTPLDLSNVSPTNITSTSLLHGVVTIKWPYSSSTQKLTFLLADPDPRKRASGGQVKITLAGQAAVILDQTESGEDISIAATRNNTPLIEEENSPRIKWHITFPEGCILIVFSLCMGCNGRLKTPRLDHIHLRFQLPKSSSPPFLACIPRQPHHPLPRKDSGKLLLNVNSQN